MAYNNGFPMTYQQPYQLYNYQQPPIVQQQPVSTTNDTGILWVQGEAGAKSWAVAPGKSVLLMDSESNTFYIKSSDNSGMPMPLRVFEYTERTTSTEHKSDVDMSNFVTRDELEEKLRSLQPKRHREEVIIDE